MSGTRNSKGRGGPTSTGRSTGKAGKGRNVVSAARPTQSGRGTLLAAIGLVVVLAVVVGGIVYNHSRTATADAGSGSATAAAVSVQDGVVTVGSSEASVHLDAYEDFICPICQQFEGIYGKQIAAAQDNGSLAVSYHLLDFLNVNSASGDYSSRAAGAALCVASDGDGSAFPAFHTALYSTANQPKEKSGSDLSNDQLATLAGSVGASETAQQCIASGADTALAKQASSAGQAQLQAADLDVATPTILHGTTMIDINDGSWLADLL